MLQFLLTQIGKLKTAVSGLNSQLTPEDVSSWFETTDITVNFAYKFGRIVYYNVLLSNFNMAATTAFSRQVVKISKLPSKTLLPCIYAGRDDFPILAASMNTSGVCSIRPIGTAISNAWYTISGILIYDS